MINLNVSESFSWITLIGLSERFSSTKTMAESMTIKSTASISCAFKIGIVWFEKVSAPMATVASQPSSLIGKILAVTSWFLEFLYEIRPFSSNSLLLYFSETTFVAGKIVPTSEATSEKSIVPSFLIT